MRTFFPAVGSLVTASLVTLAYPAFSLSPVIWFALVPWFFVLDRQTSVTQGLVQGAWVGFFFSLGTFYWVVPGLRNASGVSLPRAMTLLFAFAVVNQIQFALSGALWVKFRAEFSSVGIRLVAFIAAYLVFDSAIPKLYHDSLALSLYASPLFNQAADLGGMPLLNALIVGTNGLLYFARWRAAIAVMLALSLYGYFRRPAFARTEVGAVTIRVLKAPDLGAPYLDLAETALAPSRILVWPESGLDMIYGNGDLFSELRLATLREWQAQSHATLLAGLRHSESGHLTNALVMFDERGERFYHKRNLFPFIEYTPPWAEWIGFARYPWRGSAAQAVYDLTLADGKRVKLGPLICYDVIDPAFAREAVRGGAQILLEVANDSDYRSTAEARNHAATATFRAIETRRPLVRVAHGGFSGLILPDGSWFDMKGPGDFGATDYKVASDHHVTTFFTEHGDWVFPLAVAGLLAALVIQKLQRALRHATDVFRIRPRRIGKIFGTELRE